MPEVFCDTSPVQYLHQLGLLGLLHDLAGRVTLAASVAEELEAGRALGLDLPDVNAFDWLVIRTPATGLQHLPVSGLGRGETDTIRLALEAPAGAAVVILDDARARDEAERLGLKLKGTLGLLLDAKRAGLLERVAPHVERLDALGFRLARHTREAVLRLAGEAA